MPASGVGAHLRSRLYSPISGCKGQRPTGPAKSALADRARPPPPVPGLVDDAHQPPAAVLDRDAHAATVTRSRIGCPATFSPLFLASPSKCFTTLSMPYLACQCGDTSSARPGGSGLSGPPTGAKYPLQIAIAPRSDRHHNRAERRVEEEVAGKPASAPTVGGRFVEWRSQ